MHIGLHPQVKNKSIVTAVITFLLFIYNVFDIWSNFEFIGQKSGVIWQGLYFLIGTPSGARILVVIAMGLFMFTLLFDVRRSEKEKGPWHKTPEYDLTPRAAEAKAQESEAPPPAERIVVDVSPEYLSNFFKEHTTAQANKLAESFIGKWIRASGFVAEVIREPEQLLVAIKRPRENTERAEIDMLVMGYFHEQRWIDRAITLRRETAVTILGQINRVNQFAVYLSKCELIDSDSTE